MNRLIAIGDIHGCYHTLKDLMSKINFNSENDILIFLGDYIDRGNFSYEVVNFLINLQNTYGRESIICLRGNHEQMAIDASTSGDNHVWLMNGGQSTLDSFYKNHIEDMSRYIRWFDSLPFFVDSPHVSFCHAGSSHKKMSDNSRDDLIWGRGWIKEEREPREKKVIFGHTPKGREPYTTYTGDICIDTACVYGGNLCALIIDELGDEKYILARKNELDVWG